jgi:hypothetical protein
MCLSDTDNHIVKHDSDASLIKLSNFPNNAEEFIIVAINSLIKSCRYPLESADYASSDFLHSINCLCIASVLLNQNDSKSCPNILLEILDEELPYTKIFFKILEACIDCRNSEDKELLELLRDSKVFDNDKFCTYFDVIFKSGAELNKNMSFLLIDYLKN